MPNPNYIKPVRGAWAAEGLRGVSESGLEDQGSEIAEKIRTIHEAMSWEQLIIFNYSGGDRVVAPFVLGVSSAGVALMRGYQLEGVSRSGKPVGWRVFKVSEMLNVENHQDYFKAGDFDFKRFYPWIYKVFKML